MSRVLSLSIKPKGPLADNGNNGDIDSNRLIDKITVLPQNTNRVSTIQSINIETLLGDCMDINIDRLTNEFCALAGMDSPSFGEKEVCDYLKRQLIELGFSVAEDQAGTGHENGCGNLYGYLNGEETLGAPLLLCAHMDTVEPSQGKRAVISEDGRITSAGDTVLGADDISGMTAILEALRVIDENGIRHRPIEVLFTVAEEVYCGGASQFDFSQIRSKQAYVLDLSGPIGTAAFCAPSILFFTATVTGKSAHAGFEPKKGVHAIAAAADAVSKLKLGHIGEEATLNIGVIQGGRATNIVPDECIVRGEARSFSHHKALELVETVKQQFNDSAAAIGASAAFEVTEGCKAYETPVDHPVADRFRNVCKSMEIEAKLIKTFGGSDNNYLAAHGITGLVAASGMHDCHTCAEYTTVEELAQSARLVASLIVSDDGAEA